MHFQPFKCYTCIKIVFYKVIIYQSKLSPRVTWELLVYMSNA